MATLAQLRSRTRRLLHETNEDTSFWDATVLDQVINQSYRRRCSQMIMAFEGWFVNIAQRDIETSKAQYAFPDGFIRMHKLEVVRSDGRTVPIHRDERHESMNPSEGVSGDGYLPDYRPLGNGFILEPSPVETVTNGLRMEYVGVPVLLTAAGDSLHPSFPEIFEELIVIDSAIYCLDIEGSHEIGQLRSLLRARAEWEEDFQRFIEQRVVSRSQIDPFVPHYNDG